VTLVRAEEAKVRQISAVPRCAFVRITRTHVSPAPETLFTATFVLEMLSAEINAKSNSFAEEVENLPVETDVFFVPWSTGAMASIVT
jgi:hypothetical protein